MTDDFYPLPLGWAVVCCSQDPSFHVELQHPQVPAHLSLNNGICWHNGQKHIYNHDLSSLFDQLSAVKLSLSTIKFLILL